MMTPETDHLTNLVLAKIDEQITCLSGIVAKLPAGKLDWSPEMPSSIVTPSRRIGQVLSHLLDCLAGFVAVLYAANPDHLGRFNEIERRPRDHSCGITEALEGISLYRRRIRDGFRLLNDNKLGSALSTVFVPEAEAVLTLLLGNFEHLVNHKHEVFMYAKLLGVPLTTRDLYQFRDERHGREKTALCR